MSFTLPETGFVYWPIGTGDSTTVVVDAAQVVAQVDLRELECCDDEGDCHASIVDELVRLLPIRDNRPYLSTFILTHPDKDHIQGFEELLSKVSIGEIWHSPRVFMEYKKDLCEDAQKFVAEVDRRRKETIDNHGVVPSGDRVRVIGHADIFEKPEYKNFPDYWRSFPGSSITSLDGVDHTGVFEAFIHAPFKDDCDGDRNESSLAFQIVLSSGNQVGKALFLGDLCYPAIKRIFDKTKEKQRPQYLSWNVLLAPHHGSKSAMYWQDDPERDEVLKKDILADFESAALEPSYLVVSSESDFSDAAGKNPPHLKARKRYEEIVDAGHFLCTHEHPNTSSPDPICFCISADGFTLRQSASTERAEANARLTAAVAQARGGGAPPKSQVGFGNRGQSMLWGDE